MTKDSLTEYAKVTLTYKNAGKQITNAEMAQN